MFFLSLFIYSNTTNKIAPVTEMDLNNVLLSSDYCTNKSDFEFFPEFGELALGWMLAHNLTFPTNVEEARQLYDNFLWYISIIENSWVEGISINETFAENIINKYIVKFIW